MKKLLGIIVLGLLLSSNAYAEIRYVCVYDANNKKTRHTDSFLIENGKVYIDDKMIPVKKGALNQYRLKYLKTSSSSVEFSYKFVWSEHGSDGKKTIYSDTTHYINLKTNKAFEKDKYTTEYFNKSGELIRTEETMNNDILQCTIITNSGSSGIESVLKSILKAIN